METWGGGGAVQAPVLYQRQSMASHFILLGRIAKFITEVHRPIR